MNFRAVILSIVVILVSDILADFPYKELVPGFKRTDSKIMAREISRATLANLDLAAYDKNPLLLKESRAKPDKMPETIGFDTLSFNEAINSAVNSIDETPLTEDEKNSPVAWQPLLKRLWNVVKDGNLQNFSGKIASYKWNNPDIYQSFQEITTAYIHHGRKEKHLWVKIDFCFWVPSIKNVSDSDNDGIREIYAELNLQKIHPDSLNKMYEWIGNTYCQKLLTEEEARAWVTELTSYWYPSLNTDLVDLEENKIWPDKRVKRKIRKELKGLTFKNPFAVIEGKPFNPRKPVYNVFIIHTDSVKTDLPAGSKNRVKTDIADYDSTVSENFISNMIRFEKELSLFGRYEEWNGKNSSFFENVKRWIDMYPEEQMGIEGVDGWLFFRKSLEVLTKNNKQTQLSVKDAIGHIVEFKKYLEKTGVNFLFVAVPDKEMIYFDKFTEEMPLPEIAFINAYARKLLKGLQESGVEVIDLLPRFLEAKEKDSCYLEFVYQKQDTHWSHRGIMITAELIAERVKEYSWYKKEEKTEYITIDTSFERGGDIVGRLPEKIRSKYPPFKVNAKQVFCESDSSLFKSKRSAPVMLIGDSFTGVFESVDCKGAGVGAQTAAKTRLPVDIITSWGGGPLVRNKAMRMRHKELQSKRLVIYLMASRDIFNYSLEWEPLSIPQ